MKKKFLAMASAAVMAITLMAGCSSDDSSNSSASGDSEKKVLRVGMECAYAPFNWSQTESTLSNGDTAVPIYGSSDYAYGYDVMVAQKLADEIGYELEIHRVDWSSIVLGMETGDYDVIIAGMGYTAERAEAVEFTQPYYIRDNVVIVKKDGALASATSLTDFTGASGTTQLGTIWEQYVPQVPEVEQLTYFETTSEVVMAVSMGSADFGVLDEPTAMSAAIANPDITFIKFEEGSGFTVPEGQSLNVCVATKKGNTELCKLLDDALTAIEWNQDKMVELMNTAVELQPLSD